MIQVAYADDHELVRKGTISLLSSAQIKFVLEAEHGEEMLQLLEQEEVLPDICMVDISMPVMDGFALVAEMKKRWPEIGVLVLTAYKSDLNIIRMIKAGANGYLLKSTSPAEIKLALQLIHETGFYFSELVSNKLYHMVQHVKESAINFTEREMEFLQYCCSDLSYEQIAEAMNVSSRTVHGYCERIFAKFGVNSRIGLVLVAMKSGIVP
ncbi:response regulator transcription factor [Parapedobacter sp. 10938]|uniref:response regulator transcription factor n=1 Tax=Parapedobacter flavus TaxID=3110225 RepID=UPI002DB5BF09|nr:response regulator transcription factor [Parapedobacter sp. 10938]MEC3880205.1 response regulator transcription factor [Parapedobacter sp. 10938]